MNTSIGIHFLHQILLEFIQFPDILNGNRTICIQIFNLLGEVETIATVYGSINFTMGFFE